VTAVAFGVESAGGPRGEIPVTVLLRKIPKSAPLTWANAPVITTSTVLATATQPRLIHVEMVDVMVNPLVDDLVVEIAAWEGTAPPWLNSYFFIGTNTAPEIRPTYWSSQGCRVGEPVTLEYLGIRGQHAVMIVYLSDPPVSTALTTWGRVKSLYR
jgi:hypothetical protein